MTTHKCRLPARLWSVEHDDGSWTIKRSSDDTSFIHNHSLFEAGFLSANQQYSERFEDCVQMLKLLLQLGLTADVSLRLLQCLPTVIPDKTRHL